MSKRELEQHQFVESCHEAARQIIDMSDKHQHFGLFSSANTALPIHLDPLVEAIFRGNVEATRQLLEQQQKSSPALFQEAPLSAAEAGSPLNQTDMLLVKTFQAHDANIMLSPMKVALARAAVTNDSNAVEIVVMLRDNATALEAYCNAHQLAQTTSEQAADFAETMGDKATEALASALNFEEVNSSASSAQTPL